MSPLPSMSDAKSPSRASMSCAACPDKALPAACAHLGTTMLASDEAPDAGSAVGYQPLALSPGWLLERFHGWRVLLQEPGLKLLERRIGPLTRHLILANGAQSSLIDDLASRHAI